MLALAACSPGAYRALTPEEYRAQIPTLEARAEAAPADAEAQGRLGEALAQTEQYARALPVLERAVELDPADGRARYYLGTAYEALDRPGDALGAYGGFGQVDPRSPFRPLMEGRRTIVLRAELTRELERLAAQEDSLQTAAVTDAVAVFPLSYRGTDSLYAPIGRGLAEMVSADLARIAGIRVVERVRLQVLLTELEMSQGPAFDPARTPQMGRLLGSGRLVFGGYDADAARLETDVALGLTEAGTLAGETVEERGTLEELFAIERRIVLRVAEQLGVTLTPPQLAELERVPTRDLQAFIAYSRGLIEEDAGRFEAAASLFQTAAQLDPGFVEAAQAAQSAQAAASVNGEVEAALVAARRVAVPGVGLDGLVGDRLDRLNGTLGNAVVPTGDEPTVTVPLDPTGLPDPPPPPPRGNN